VFFLHGQSFRAGSVIVRSRPEEPEIRALKSAAYKPLFLPELHRSWCYGLFPVTFLELLAGPTRAGFITPHFWLWRGTWTGRGLRPSSLDSLKRAQDGSIVDTRWDDDVVVLVDADDVGVIFRNLLCLSYIEL
jgi:hypothetical protein